MLSFLYVCCENLSLVDEAMSETDVHRKLNRSLGISSISGLPCKQKPKSGKPARLGAHQGQPKKPIASLVLGLPRLRFLIACDKKLDMVTSHFRQCLTQL